MPRQAIVITLTARQRAHLENLVRTKSTAQQLVERCRIVLMSAGGGTNEGQAKILGVDVQRIRRWRRRWRAGEDALASAEAENATDKDLGALMIRVLSDHERSGTPPKFTAEQVASIIALACEPPAESGLPVSHWTPAELAREAMKRNLVESISARQVDRFLARRSFARTKAGIG